MNDFTRLLDDMKILYELGMYEDVKVYADMLIGMIDSAHCSTADFATEACTSSVTFSDAPRSPLLIKDSMTTTTTSTMYSWSNALYDFREKYAIYSMYGHAAFKLNEFKLADNLYTHALQISKSHLRSKSRQPDSESDIVIKYNLHLCHMSDKKYQDANSILCSIPSKQRDGKILLALAKVSQQLKKTTEAISYYKDVLKINKKSIVAVEALLTLGVKLDEIIKMAPSCMNIEWLNSYVKAKGQLVSRELREAVKSLKQLDTKFASKNVTILSSLATSQYLNGEYSAAQSSFEKLHRLQPTFTAKMDVYAYLLYIDSSDTEKLPTLERLANDMHNVSVNIAETWTVIGYYSLKKKSPKAKCFAENALAIDHENPQALLLRALSLGKLKAMSESAVTYREATRVNIFFFEAYKGLVETLLNLAHIKDAIQIAGNAVKLLGSTHRTLALYGEALSRDPSSQEKSKIFLQKAIKSDPNNQEAVICLVRVCMTLQQFPEAREVLGKYIRHNPSNPRLMHIYSELMKKCGRADEALIYMNMAAGMDTGNLQMKNLLEKAEQTMETTSHDESASSNLNII